MNDGKRLLRNTVIAIYAAAVLFFAVNRLFAATVHGDAPQWLTRVASFGLAPWTTTRLNARLLQDLPLRDFTQLHLNGRFNVEIVGASQYRLSYTAADGHALPIEVRQQGDQLWLADSARRKATAGAVLRIETPVLQKIDARNLTGLTLRGLRSPQIIVDLNDVSTASLLENQVMNWILHADVSAMVQVDKATLAAGKLLATGDVVVHYGE